MNCKAKEIRLLLHVKRTAFQQLLQQIYSTLLMNLKVYIYIYIISFVTTLCWIIHITLWTNVSIGLPITLNNNKYIL